MRAHGVPDFPDPGNAPRRNTGSGDLNPQTPAYQAALHSCQRYTRSGNMTPAQRAQGEANALRFSECMRSHGVLNFPDPSTGPSGGVGFNLSGLGIDPNSPTYQSANQACQRAGSSK